MSYTGDPGSWRAQALTAHEGVPSAPPPITWPLFWIAWSSGWLTWWLALTIIDSIDFAPWAVIAGAILTFNLRWYRRRVDARQKWRRARRVQWLFKDPLRAPEDTDWDQYERDLEVDW